MPAIDLILRVLGIVFPVFVIVVLGWVYGRRHQPDMAAANRMNMEVFIPALVFGALVEGSNQLNAQWLPALAMAIMVLGSGLLSWPVARLLKVPVLTLAPPMMFNNCGNLGIPLTVLAFGNDSLPVAVILFLSSNLLHFSVGASMLNREQALLSIFKVPVVLASVLGLGAALIKISLWPPLITAIRLVGDIAVPLMLFALGVKVAEAPLKHFWLGFWAGLLRPVFGILCMLLTITFFQIPQTTAAILILFGSLPPAVLNYMFAERYHQQPEEVASIVLMGNLLAVLVLPLVLAWILV